MGIKIEETFDVQKILFSFDKDSIDHRDTSSLLAAASGFLMGLESTWLVHGMTFESDCFGNQLALFIKRHEPTKTRMAGGTK